MSIQVTVLFFSAAALLFAALKKQWITGSFLYIVFTAIYTVSLFPSTDIPYIIDDFDQLFLLSRAIDNGTVAEWIFLPHNEHVIPLLKLFYYVFYTVFWVSPQAFHYLIILVCAGIAVLIYKLLEMLTGSRDTGLAGAAVWICSSLPNFASFVITNATILFCLFFLLLLFYAQWKFHATEKKVWLWLAAFSIFCAPLTFALGVPAIFFVWLFSKWCLPHRHPLRPDRLTVFLSFIWLLAVIPYFFLFDKVIHTAHYRDIGATSAFDQINILVTFKSLAIYFYYYLVPRVLNDFYLSFGAFFLALYAGIRYRKEIAWKKIAFFVLFGVINVFIITLFRSGWGGLNKTFSRYDVFPVMMMSFLYAFILCPWIRQTFSDANRKMWLFIVPLFFLVTSGSAHRYHQAQKVSRETAPVQRMFLEYSHSINSYFKKYPETGILRIENSGFFFPPAFELGKKIGTRAVGVERYPRNFRFLSQFLLSEEIRRRIVWADTTEGNFLEHLRANSDIYVYMNGILNPPAKNK